MNLLILAVAILLVLFHVPYVGVLGTIGGLYVLLSSALQIKIDLTKKKEEK